MNYLKQILEFEKLNEGLTLSASARSLYYSLLYKNNHLGWKKEISLPNKVLQSISGIDHDTTFYRARQSLVQSELIHYSKGKKGQAGIYEIVDISNKTEPVVVSQVVSQVVPRVVPNVVGRVVSSGTYNKQNKIKQKSKKEIDKEKEPHTPKNSFGEFKNVKLTEQEYKNLIIDYGDKTVAEYIERLGGYMQANGKRYKSHYAVIQNWTRKDGIERWSKQNNIELN